MELKHLGFKELRIKNNRKGKEANVLKYISILYQVNFEVL